MKNRRNLIIALGASALAAPRPSLAQQPVKIARIGLLVFSGDRNEPRLVAFRDELAKLGWIEGKNIHVEYRSAEGRSERLPALLSELVALKVDVLVTASTPTAIAAKSAIRDIPIIFSMVSDPVASGLVTSLARPGENLTGWSNMLPQTSAKLLELLKEVVPKASSIAVMLDPSNPGKELEFKALQAAGQRWELKLQSMPVRGLADIKAAFSAMAQQRPDGLIVLQDTVTSPNRVVIVEAAAGIRLPAVYQVSEFADAGGLLSFGLNQARQFRRSAYYVDRILKGAKPGDLPVEQPNTFELVINMKTAKALGIAIPQPLLLRADEVIR